MQGSSMPSLVQRTKIHALASVAACGVLFAMASSAAARNYERCAANGDHCVRIHCDNDGNGDMCWRQSTYFRTAYYHHDGTWACDGDTCHYVYRGLQWRPRHWDDMHITPDNYGATGHN